MLEIVSARTGQRRTITASRYSPDTASEHLDEMRRRAIAEIEHLQAGAHLVRLAAEQRA
jgi:hypothetical protein